MNYAEWLHDAATQLIESDSAKRDTEILLAFITGKTRSFIIAFAETQLSENQLVPLNQLLQRRKKGEPIAYLTGEREFWSISLQVSPATLIPRPDTECLVEMALKLLPIQQNTVLDLGTGTGAIALAIAKERLDCQVTAVDIAAEAIELAKQNAKRLNIHNVSFLVGSWFEPLKTQLFSMIVSNPPYIDKEDPHLDQGDVRFEPRRALVAEQQGLADLMQIIHHAGSYLQHNGWLLLEHGWQQAEAVRLALMQAGFHNIRTVQDYAEQDRVTLGCWRER